MRQVLGPGALWEDPEEAGGEEGGRGGAGWGIYVTPWLIYVNV